MCYALNLLLIIHNNRQVQFYIRSKFSAIDGARVKKINILREQHSKANFSIAKFLKPINNEVKREFDCIKFEFANWQKNQFGKMNCLTLVCNGPMKIRVLFESIYFVAEWIEIRGPLLVRCTHTLRSTEGAQKKKERKEWKLWYLFVG